MMDKENQLTNELLTMRVRQISLDKFQRPFLHQAYWNYRLISTGGRFFPKDGHLDFNPRMAELPEFERIVLHELTHYHLFMQHRGYRHQDVDFKATLKKVGGSRYAPTITNPKFTYQCENCGLLFYRQRKIKISKYRCGKCGGKLILQNKKEHL